MATYYVQQDTGTAWRTIALVENDRLLAQEMARLMEPTGRALRKSDVPRSEREPDPASADYAARLRQDAQAAIDTMIADVEVAAERYWLVEVQMQDRLYRAIREARERGVNLRILGEAAGLTTSRIHQIVESDKL